MKKPGKKLCIHLGFIVSMILFALLGMPIIFTLINLSYALFIAVIIFRSAIRGESSRLLKVITGILLIIGLAPMVSLMLIPSFFVSVADSEKNPDIGENIPEYSYRHGIKLRNASYFISYMSQAYEGDLSENDFKKLARLCDWDYQKFDQPQEFEYSATELIRSHRSQDKHPRPVTIQSGCIYQYRQSNGGGLLVMYDLNSQRLYTHSNPR